jgi:hypothetical protein
MARNLARDKRQGDLFGAPPPPAKPARRTSPPKPAREEIPAAPASLATLGAKATRPEIDKLLDSMPDQELAYLAVEATRLVKRRLVRGGAPAKRHRQRQVAS